jgi:hypothetical protein
MGGRGGTGRGAAAPVLVVADADRLVARSFGIWAWPVTVWIRPDQRIEAIDIGATGLSGTAPTRA